jgi:hypothetical protein
MMTKRMYAILVSVLTVALMAAATLLSTKTYIRPDVGSVSLGFPLSWLSIAHGFINAPPSWTIDAVGLTGDLLTWLVVSLAAVYLWIRVSARDRSTKLKVTGVKVTN